MKKPDLRKRKQRRERRRIAGASQSNPRGAVGAECGLAAGRAVSSVRAVAGGEGRSIPVVSWNRIRVVARPGICWACCCVRPGSRGGIRLSATGALAAGEAGPDLLSNLGLVYRAVGQLDAARESLERAVAARADSADTVEQLGYRAARTTPLRKGRGIISMWRWRFSQRIETR